MNDFVGFRSAQSNLLDWKEFENGREDKGEPVEISIL